MNTEKVIAIDGTAASGKGSASKRVARVLEFIHLDTGIFYRSVGLLALRGAYFPEDLANSNARVDSLVHQLSVGDGNIRMNGRIVGDEIRTPEVEMITSHIAPNPYLRRRLVPLQRQFLTDRGLVAEGRNMTSEIFTDARLKIYMDADISVRAGRRRVEYVRRGIPVPLERIIDEIQERDRLDQTRKDSPLIRVPDAHYIDTSNLTEEAVAAEIVALWRKTVGE